MHPLERHILGTIRREGLVPPATRGLVCVSGGPDSLALLHLLAALRGPLDAHLEAVHFDHGLRPESAAEAEWVARQAGALGLPLHVVRAPHLAGRASGVQAAARAWRRAESRRLMAQWGADWAATGHQRDDQMETILLKWLRGAHLSRLRGMAWRVGRFVRPLLETRRETLEAYLRDRGTDWLEDPSNLSPRYKRNRVRHELMPLLEALSEGGLERRLADMEHQSRLLADWLDATLAQHKAPQNDPARPPHWIAVEGLAGLPALPRSTLLHGFVQARLPGTLPYAQIARAVRLLDAGEPEWTLHLAGGRILRRRGDRLVLEPRADGAPPPPLRHTVAGRPVDAPPGWLVREARGEEPALTLHNVPPAARLEVRPRREGDRFQPPWKAHPVRLAAFLRDQRVPLWERDRLPVVVLGGRVIAVHPHFVAAGHAAAARDEPPLRLVVEPASPLPGA